MKTSIKKKFMSITLALMMTLSVLVSPLGDLIKPNVITAEAATSTTISGNITINSSYEINWDNGIHTATGSGMFCGAKFTLSGDVSTTKTGGGSAWNVNRYEWTYNTSSKVFTHYLKYRTYEFDNADTGVKCECISHGVAGPVNGNTGTYSGTKTVSETTSGGNITTITTYNITASIPNKQDLAISWSESKTRPANGTIQLHKIFYNGTDTGEGKSSYRAFDSNTGADGGNYNYTGRDSMVMAAFPKTYALNNIEYVLYYNNNGTIVPAAKFQTDSIGGTTEKWKADFMTSVGTGKMYDQVKGPAGKYYWKENIKDSSANGSYWVVPIGGSNITVSDGGNKSVNNSMSFDLAAGGTAKFGWFGTTARTWNEAVGANAPVIAEIELTKHGPDSTYPDPNMAGATFDVWYYETTPSASIETAMSNFKYSVSKTKKTASVTSATGWTKVATLAIDSSGKTTMSSSMSRTISGKTYKPTFTDGKLSYLPAGNYAIIETKAPTGYLIPSNPVKTINSSTFKNKTNNISGSNAKLIREYASAKNNYVNVKVDVTEDKGISFRMDKDYQPLANTDMTAFSSSRYKKTGAKYEIRLNNSTGTILANGVSDSNGHIIWTLTDHSINNTTLELAKTVVSDDTIDNISKGTVFYIAETSAPNGFELATPSTVTINSDTYIKSNYSCSIEYPVYGQFGIEKLVEDQESTAEQDLTSGLFDGAKFEVYYTRTNNSISSGFTAFKVEDVDASHRQLTIFDGYEDSFQKFGEFSIENGKIVAKAEKVEFNGVKFTSRTDNTGTYGVFTTAPFGNYIIVETEAPSSGDIKLSEEKFYSLRLVYSDDPEIDDENPSRVQVYLNSHMDSPYLIPIVEGENKKVSITLNKVPENEETAVGNLTGAEYELYYAPTSGTDSVPNGCTFSDISTSGNFYTRTVKSILINGNANNSYTKIATFTVDKNGIGKISSYNETYAFTEFNGKTFIEIPGNGLNKSVAYGAKGTYVLVETKAPKNYGFDDEVYAEYLDPDASASMSITSEEPCVEDPFNLRIKKKAANVGNTDIDLSNIKGLDGTQFTVTFYKGLTEVNQITSSKAPDKILKYKVINGKVEFNKSSYLTSGTPYTNEYGNIIWPVGIAVITETKATDGYETNNSTWTDKSGNNFCMSNKGLFARISQDPEDIEFGITEFWNGSSWVEDQTLSVELDGINEPQFEVINDVKTGKFEFHKSVMLEDGVTEEDLENAPFTLYYFYNSGKTAEEIADWENKYHHLIHYIDTMEKDSNGVYEYTKYLDLASWSDNTIRTGSNGVYTSGDLPIGDYILVENSGDANKGLILSKPWIFTITEGTNPSAYEEIINYTPSLSTQEWDGNLSSDDYKTHMTNPNKNAKILDKVSYKNLEGNKKYTVKGVLMDITNGNPVIFKDASGNMVQSYANFTTSNEVELASNDVLVEFPLFDATGKDGHKFVVYEFLFDGTNTTALTESDVNILTGKSTGTVTGAVVDRHGKIIGHYDSTDINQIGYFPEIHTNEYDSSTLNHVSPIWENENGFTMEGKWVEVNDTLTYKNLDTEMVYYIVVEIKDYDTNKVIDSVVKVLKPSKSDDTYTIEKIQFDGSDYKKFYITEVLHKDSANGTVVASHTAKVADQTGMIARIGTNAMASSATGKQENGINLAYISSNVTLTDIIKCENLNNELYDITCEYHYVGGSHAGELVKDATGKELKITLTNQKLGDNDFEVSIKNLNLTNLKDETIVAYETIIWHNSNGEDVVVAKEHEDTSKVQSVKFIGIPVKFNKINTDGTSLAGCTLEIRAGSKTGTLVDSWTTDGSTMHTAYMETGVYYLVETDAPNGYALADPVKFEIKGDGFVYVNDKKLEDGIVTIADAQLTKLPTAGGIGTTWFSLLGIMALLGSAYFVKKKQTD